MSDEREALIAFDSMVELIQVGQGDAYRYSKGELAGAACDLVHDHARTIRRALATPSVAAPEVSEADRFCDGNCVWTDHHPECVRASDAPATVGDRSFSDFVRNATDAEREAVMLKVADDAAEAQRETVRAATVGDKCDKVAPLLTGPGLGTSAPAAMGRGNVIDHPRNPPAPTYLSDEAMAAHRQEARERGHPIPGPSPNRISKTALACPFGSTYRGEVMSAEREALIARLLRGVVCHERRWSGDTHADLGGTVDEDATNTLMREAAEALATPSVSAAGDGAPKRSIMEWREPTGGSIQGGPMPPNARNAAPPVQKPAESIREAGDVYTLDEIKYAMEQCNYLSYQFRHVALELRAAREVADKGEKS